MNNLYESWSSGGCVDEHTLDQLIIFMALAKGKSRLLCPKKSSITSQHVKTAIHFAELLSGAKFIKTNIDIHDKSEINLDKPYIIECDGIGLEL